MTNPAAPSGTENQARDGAGQADPTPVQDLSYEQARNELADLVGRLESGSVGLEESLALWERGESLAAHCQAWLDGAVARLDAARAEPGAQGAQPSRRGSSQTAGVDEGSGTGPEEA